MSVRPYLLYLLLILLAACSSIAVKKDYDVNFNFDNLKYYAWPKQEVNNPSVHNSLVEDRVYKAVDNQLQVKGFLRAQNGKVDFIVNYHYLARKVIERDKISAGLGIGSSMGYDSVFGGIGMGIPLGIQSSR